MRHVIIITFACLVDFVSYIRVQETSCMENPDSSVKFPLVNLLRKVLIYRSTANLLCMAKPSVTIWIYCINSDTLSSLVISAFPVSLIFTPPIHYDLLQKTEKHLTDLLTYLTSTLDQIDRDFLSDGSITGTNHKAALVLQSKTNAATILL